MPRPTPRWRSGPQQRLPRTVAPFQNETVHSFLYRLATANHISVLDLEAYLAEPLQPRTHPATPRPEWLSIASGWPTPLLTSRLCWPTARHRTNKPIPACRSCMARRGVFQPVRIHRRPHVQVCLKHQLWIGGTGDDPDTQLDLSNLPEVIRAQRRHNRLARLHGTQATHTAHTDARHILARWTERGDWPHHRERRLDTYFGHPHWQVRVHSAEMHAANYPEIVALTAILVSDHWRSHATRLRSWPHTTALNGDPDHQRFYAEVSRHLQIEYNPSSYDPLTNWVDKHTPTIQQLQTIDPERLLGPPSMTTPQPSPAIETGPPLIMASPVVQHH